LQVRDAMLGRKPRGEQRRPPVAAATTPAKSSRERPQTKKRKWQEDNSDESDSEAKITKEDLDAFKKTLEEEEKEEARQRQKEELKAKEVEKEQREQQEAERQRKTEEEAQAVREAEEARKQAEEAEAERRRFEANSFVGAGPLPMDNPSILPAGVRPGKEHLYKTSYCKRWEQGTCNFGAACHFAHGERELRGRPPKGSSSGSLSVPFPEVVVKPLSTRALVPPTPPPPMAMLPPSAEAGAGALSGGWGLGGPLPLGVAPPPPPVLPPDVAAQAAMNMMLNMVNGGEGAAPSANPGDCSAGVPRVIPPPMPQVPD